MKLRRSYLWAVLMLLGISGWMASGILLRNNEGTATAARQNGDTPAAGEAAKPVAVRVARMTARERRSELIVRGRTEAVRSVTVRAETAGVVMATPMQKGATVPKGSLLCQLDIAEREAKVAEARAAVTQFQLDFDAAKQLMKRGFAAANDEAARKARLDAANAALKQAEITLARTRVRAPFDGVVDGQDAEVGAFVGVGDACATLVDLDPLLIVGQVSERDIGKLRVGMHGQAALVTGETVDGTIRFIGASADQATRTFRVELSVPNARRQLRDGITAQITLPLAPETAHRFSPAILALDDDGAIGIRTIDEKGTVSFAPVSIIGDDVDGVWVTGLPETVTVITVGQDFVTAGQVVEPVFSTAEAQQ